MQEGKNFQFKASEEQVNLLQRYGYEYDTRCDIVARLISRASSADEIDKGALAHYQRLADESKAMFETAKTEFGESVVRPRVEERFGADVPFRWKIPSYADLMCEVEVG